MFKHNCLPHVEQSTNTMTPSLFGLFAIYLCEFLSNNYHLSSIRKALASTFHTWSVCCSLFIANFENTKIYGFALILQQAACSAPVNIRHFQVYKMDSEHSFA